MFYSFCSNAAEPQTSFLMNLAVQAHPSVLLGGVILVDLRVGVCLFVNNFDSYKAFKYAG